MTDPTRQRDCPYCGVSLDGQPISDHVRHAHIRDKAGEYRCPAVVAMRRELGLPEDGHGANIRHRPGGSTPRNDRGKFTEGEV